MKKKIFSIFFVLVLVLTLSLVTAMPVAAATTLHVDDDGVQWPGAYTTITTALGAASTGDTIIVHEGIYSGFTVNVTNLSILGAQANVDAAGSTDRGGTTGDADESVITGTVIITADDITLNGFKMTSSYIAVGYLHAHNVNISYNILENVTATWGAIHLHGTATGPSYHEADGGYIGYNTISGAVGKGIWTVGNDDVTIEYNHVLNNTGDRAIEAINHVGTGIVIHSNIISNSGGKGINYWADDGGIITDNIITNSAYEAIFTDAQATISGNQIVNTGGYGILVANGAGGSIVSENIISNPSYEGIQSDVPVTITNNDVSGGYNGIQLSNTASSSVIEGNNIHDNQYWGLSVQPSVTAIIVEYNQFINNPYCGVMVWGDGEGSGININFNNITGNGIYGVESQRSLNNVDATNNWWGHASGPSGQDGRVNKKGKVIGKGDAVSANVEWEPWLPQPVNHTPRHPVPPGLFK